MLGVKTKRIIVDADALIGLLNENDALHQRCLKIEKFLDQNDYETIIPYTAILEAATTLSRATRPERPELAQDLLNKATHLRYPLDIDSNIAGLVASVYNDRASKKNTPFDCYILALARRNNIKCVFSFDAFYKKQGLILIEESVLEHSDIH